MSITPTAKFLKTLADIKILNILLVQKLGGSIDISQSELEDTERDLRSGELFVEAYRSKENNNVTLKLERNKT